MEKISTIVCTTTRYLCELHNITIGELEEEIGVSKGYISRGRKGNKLISIDCCLAIAKRFGITVNDLIYPDYLNEIRRLQIKELEKQIEVLKKEIGESD